MAEDTTIKSDKIKFWGLVIVAILSAYSTTISTITQATGAKDSSVKTIVSQINDRVIPEIQNAVTRIDDRGDGLLEENYKLRERVAILEVELKNMKNSIMVTVPRIGGHGFVSPKPEEQEKEETAPKQPKRIKLPKVKI